MNAQPAGESDSVDLAALAAEAIVMLEPTAEERGISFVLDKVAIAEGKTKALQSHLDKLGLKNALIIGAENDSVASVTSHSQPFYTSLPSTTKKAYMELNNADHFFPQASSQYPLVGKRLCFFLLPCMMLAGTLGADLLDVGQVPDRSGEQACLGSAVTHLTVAVVAPAVGHLA